VVLLECQWQAKPKTVKCLQRDGNVDALTICMILLIKSAEMVNGVLSIVLCGCCELTICCCLNMAVCYSICQV